MTTQKWQAQKRTGRWKILPLPPLFIENTRGQDGLLYFYRRRENTQSDSGTQSNRQSHTRLHKQAHGDTTQQIIGLPIFNFDIQNLLLENEGRLDACSGQYWVSERQSDDEWNDSNAGGITHFFI